MNDNKDAFDLWWEWAEKPVDSMLTIDAAIHDAVMALPPDERRDRAKVNEAVRDGLALGPLRSAGRIDTGFRRRRNKTLRHVHDAEIEISEGPEPPPRGGLVQ